MAHAQLPEHYAESTMLFALSEDGKQEVSLRLARFPLTGKATVWLHVADGERAWAMAHETFSTETRATPVQDENVSFTAHHGAQFVRFKSDNRSGQNMQGNLAAELLAAATRHPKLGEGTVPVALDLQYQSASQGYRSETGRWEMTGTIKGTVTVQGKTIAFNNPGKWHEQIGSRGRFAPAFTYFNVQNDTVALLAIAFAESFVGYGMLDGQLYELQAFEIQELQTESRSFRAELYSAQTDSVQVVEGRARTVQQWSVPIEGQRRPGAAVIVETNIGQMFGSLNDWQPQP